MMVGERTAEVDTFASLTCHIGDEVVRVRLLVLLPFEAERMQVELPSVAERMLADLLEVRPDLPHNQIVELEEAVHPEVAGPYILLVVDILLLELLEVED